jgi:hypothetical protein
MKKNKNASSQQGHLIAPAVVVDLRKLYNYYHTSLIYNATEKHSTE